MRDKIEFKSKEIIFLGFIIFISVTNLIANGNNLNFLSILNSLVGITGSVLFVYRKPISSKLIYFWAVSQVIIIKPYIDFSQILQFTLGFTAGKFGFYLNIFGLIYLAILKLIESTLLVGKKITFYQFRETELGDVFPLSGTVVENIDFGKDKNYILVELDSPILYREKSIKSILTKSNDPEKNLKLGRKEQVAFFRLIENENDVLSREIDDFPFIDWVYAK